MFDLGAFTEFSDDDLTVSSAIYSRVGVEEFREFFSNTMLPAYVKHAMRNDAQ